MQNKKIKWLVDGKETKTKMIRLLQECSKYIDSSKCQEESNVQCTWNEKGFKLHRNNYNKNNSFDEFTLFQLSECEYMIAFAYWYIKHFGLHLKKNISQFYKEKKVVSSINNNDEIDDDDYILELFNYYEICQLLLQSLVQTEVQYYHNNNILSLKRPHFPIRVQKRIKKQKCT